MTYLVVTPISKELKYLSAYLVKNGFRAYNRMTGRLLTIEFPDLDLILAQGGLGKAQFGLQTQHLLDHCPSVRAVVCAGAAGALAMELQVGDVVIASETVEHDCIYRFVERPAPRFPGNADLVAQFEKLTETVRNEFDIYVGTMASGDEDIVERGRAEEIGRLTGAVAVAWEGAGGARACQFSEVPYVEIRGITDTADHNAPGVFKQNLGQVMDHIGWMIISWIRNQKPNS
jgi:adenosylhomocysteine nucleosidase